MTFIQHYNSPLGGILLAADEIGLTGLWFNGQKYFARSLPGIQSRTPRHFRKQSAGWRFTSQARNRILCRRCILSVLRFAGLYGKFSCKFPTEKPQPTARLRDSSPKNKSFLGCRHRRWAELLGTMKYLSLFPATAWLAQTAA